MCHCVTLLKSLINVNWSTVSWCSTKAEVVGFSSQPMSFSLWPKDSLHRHRGVWSQNQSKCQKIQKLWRCMHDASAILHTKHSTRLINLFGAGCPSKSTGPAPKKILNTISLWRATASRSLRLTSRARPHLSLFDYRSPTPHATIPGTNERNGWYRPYKSSPNGSRSLLELYNVGKTIINHPFGNGLYQLFMVIWGIVYYCFTHIIRDCMKLNKWPWVKSRYPCNPLSFEWKIAGKPMFNSQHLVW